VLAGTGVRISPVELPESRQMRLTRLYPRTVVKPATRTIIVPRPTHDGQPARDTELLAWAADLVSSVLLPEPKGT
jgi:transcription-repair coupling factor (superfamily II helicase)